MFLIDKDARVRVISLMMDHMSERCKKSIVKKGSANNISDLQAVNGMYTVQ